MTTSTDEDRCQACAAYLAHYPMMADEWECEHGADEQAFMIAIADAVHGPEPVGEFTNAGWRAAQFLDDSEVALGCGHAPYVMQITHNVEPWSFMALVNGRHLIGTRNDEGAELEHIADVAAFTTMVRADAIADARRAVLDADAYAGVVTHSGLRPIHTAETVRHIAAIDALTASIDDSDTPKFARARE